MLTKSPISRRIAIFALAVLLGGGAFTLSYAATYKAGPFCYYGRNTYATSFTSQAHANSKMAAMIAQDPGNHAGECAPGETPTTPGA